MWRPNQSNHPRRLLYDISPPLCCARVRAVKMDLILVNNTGLVVSLGGGGLITPENLTLTTSSASLPPEAEIKMELIREVTKNRIHFVHLFSPECLSNRLQLSEAGALAASMRMIQYFLQHYFHARPLNYITWAPKKGQNFMSQYKI
jgi:hypothetical protein